MEEGRKREEKEEGGEGKERERRGGAPQGGATHG